MNGKIGGDCTHVAGGIADGDCTLLYENEEGITSPDDKPATHVYTNFEYIDAFYKHVFNRNSLDNKGVGLIGTVDWKFE